MSEACLGQARPSQARQGIHCNRGKSRKTWRSPTAQQKPTCSTFSLSPVLSVVVFACTQLRIYVGSMWGSISKIAAVAG